MYNRDSYIGYHTSYFEYYDTEKPEEIKRIIFVTLTSSGLKNEGQPFKGFFSTQELALDALDQEIREWIKDKPGNLQFRRLPESHKITVYELEAWGGIPTLKPKELWCATCRIAMDNYKPISINER